MACTTRKRKITTEADCTYKSLFRSIENVTCVECLQMRRSSRKLASELSKWEPWLLVALHTRMGLKVCLGFLAEVRRRRVAMFLSSLSQQMLKNEQIVVVVLVRFCDQNFPHEISTWSDPSFSAFHRFLLFDQQRDRHNILPNYTKLTQRMRMSSLLRAQKCDLRSWIHQCPKNAA